MSDLAIIQAEEPCPCCGGEGEVFLGGRPYLCYPCDGTGLKLHDPEDSPLDYVES